MRVREGDWTWDRWLRRKGHKEGICLAEAGWGWTEKPGACGRMEGGLKLRTQLWVNGVQGCVWGWGRVGDRQQAWGPKKLPPTTGNVEEGPGQGPLEDNRHRASAMFYGWRNIKI